MHDYSPFHEGVRVYTNAKVDLLTHTDYFTCPDAFDELPWLGDGLSATESILEFAGRLCYLSFGEGEVDGHRMVRGRTNNHDYLQNIKRTRHGSVLEHAYYVFLFQGVSRSLTHELVRHRHLSFSQLSQRYVDESQVAFVMPPEVQKGSEVTKEVWLSSCARDLEDYNRLSKQVERDILAESPHLRNIDLTKRVRQTARSVLPNCAETKIVVSGNPRAWRHFLFLRAAATADTEIRRLALAVGDILRNKAPNVFGDFTEHGENMDELVSEFGSF